MKRRLMMMAAVCLLIAAGAFVWLHSGSLGDAACERSRFVRSSGFSAWPPGARCAYGEPVRTDVVINGWFALVVGVLGVMFAVTGPPLVTGTR